MISNVLPFDESYLKIEALDAHVPNIENELESIRNNYISSSDKQNLLSTSGLDILLLVLEDKNSQWSTIRSVFNFCSDLITESVSYLNYFSNPRFLSAALNLFEIEESICLFNNFLQINPKIIFAIDQTVLITKIFETPFSPSLFSLLSTIVFNTKICNSIPMSVIIERLDQEIRNNSIKEEQMRKFLLLIVYCLKYDPTIAETLNEKISYYFVIKTEEEIARFDKEILLVFSQIAKYQKTYEKVASYAFVNFLQYCLTPDKNGKERRAFKGVFMLFCLDCDISVFLNYPSFLMIIFSYATGDFPFQIKRNATICLARVLTICNSDLFTEITTNFQLDILAAMAEVEDDAQLNYYIRNCIQRLLNQTDFVCPNNNTLDLFSDREMLEHFGMQIEY